MMDRRILAPRSGLVCACLTLLDPNGSAWRGLDCPSPRASSMGIYMYFSSLFLICPPDTTGHRRKGLRLKTHGAQIPPYANNAGGKNPIARPPLTGHCRRHDTSYAPPLAGIPVVDWNKRTQLCGGGALRSPSALAAHPTLGLFCTPQNVGRVVRSRLEHSRSRPFFLCTPITPKVASLC